MKKLSHKRVVDASLFQSFIYSIQWNAIATITYHLLYALHHVLLYRFLPLDQYGLIGALLASTYLAVSVTNCGLNESLGSFFRDATQSRSHFIKLVILPIIATFLLSCILCALVFFIHIPIPSSVRWQLMLLFIAESVKKPLIYTLQLFFANRSIAAVEITTISTYMSIVWGTFLYNSAQLTVPFLIGALALIIALSLFILSFMLLVHFFSLAQVTDQPFVSNTKIVTTRAFNWFVQVVRSFYSINGIITLISSRFGLYQTGNITFTCTILYSLLTMSRKVFGMTSFALFAQENNEHVFSQALRFFTKIALRAFALLTALLIITQFFTATPIHALLIALLVYFESWFFIYESFYITHNRSYAIGLALLANASAVVIIAFGHTFFLATPLTLTQLLMLFFVARILTLSALVKGAPELRPTFLSFFTRKKNLAHQN